MKPLSFFTTTQLKDEIFFREHFGKHTEKSEAKHLDKLQQENIKRFLNRHTNPRIEQMVLLSNNTEVLNHPFLETLNNNNNG
jgi:hypothetical protein